jgi:multidrug efflux pump
VLDELKRVPGRQPRLGLRPARYRDARVAPARPHGAARHLGAGRGERVQSQNQTFGIGQIGAQPTPDGVQQTFVVTAQGLLTKPERVRVDHPAHVEEGTAIVHLQRYRPRRARQARLLGREPHERQDRNHHRHLPAAGGERGGDREKRCARGWKELKKQFPSGLDYKIVLDTSLFTLNSIDKVVHTFFEACRTGRPRGLLFLQSLRATIIPILAVPVPSSARSSACISSASRSTC